VGYEIELKAWVDDWEAVEKHLRANCSFVREFRKSDRYFRSRTGPERDTWFRLRMDGGGAIVTFKEKRPRDGIEYNREREFTVDDGEAFLELVGRTDSEEYATKIKTGLEFRSEDMTVELARLEGLGSFLEIEIIAESGDEAVHARAAERIRGFLRATGISEKKIEAESYVNLLRRNEIRKD